MAKNPTLGKRALVELIGTFLFVFVGAGSAVAAQYLSPGSAALLVIAFANGLGLALAISFALNTSGGHINPAVTIGAWATKMISGRDAIAYIVAQVIGATAAGFFLVALYPSSIGVAVNYGTPSLSVGTSVLQGIIFEAVMTFFLVIVIFGTIVDKRSPRLGGLLVGLTVVADALAGGPFTGAAMNPARAIGPALASGFLTNWYVYWIGPIIGSVLAAWIYTRFFMQR
jgi:MIP family channel proteins